ncbi:purine-binding chemotaxis protein CheW [Oscillatoriales cyanobacterium LEGE 11467]|uniref:Purine-binding chemotaxis protein CheW n=2 Tax=Zarconia TaxID=2992130 RepID=A0A928Z5W7_9CYAN|nr:purine-binding chemotaxis protein CheW [Zarconia navalis LEGE 11467]
MLIFYVGKERYALDCSHVIEVIPMVSLRRVPQAPDCVAGVLNYRMTMLPVLDLSQLICGSPSRCTLSTRIAIVEYRDVARTLYCLGIIAEGMTEALTLSESQCVHQGMQLENAPYLGKTIVDDRGTIQCISLENLLPFRDRVELLPLEVKRVE